MEKYSLLCEKTTFKMRQIKCFKLKLLTENKAKMYLFEKSIYSILFIPIASIYPLPQILAVV